MNARVRRNENNVAAKFDETQRIYFHEFSVKSAEAFGAQREVLTHEAAEEMHQRDGIYLE